MKRLLPLILFIFTVSCGRYTEDESVNGNMLQTNASLKAQCQVNSVSLNKITEEYIDSELDCLKDSVALYSKGVKVARIGYISKRKLKIVIENFFKDKVETISKGVDLLFKADFLFFGGDDAYVKVENVYEIIEWFRLFNHTYMNPAFQEAILDIESGRTYSYQTHQLYRARIYKAIKKILDGLKKMRIIGASKGVRQISVPYVLDTLQRLAELFPVDTPLKLKSQKVKLKVIRRVREFDYIKKVLFGGTKGILSGNDIDRFIKIGPGLIAALFDLVRMNQIDFGAKKWHKYQLIDNALSSLEDTIYYDQNSMQALVSMTQSLDAVSKLELFKEINLKDYKKEFQVVLEKVFKVEGAAFKAKDIYRIINHTHLVLRQMIFSHKLYYQHSHILDKKTALTDSDLEAIAKTPVQNEVERKTLQQLIRIFREVRFFPSFVEQMTEIKSPLNLEKTVNVRMARYDENTYRSSTGVTAHLVYEYVMKLVFQNFGIKDQKVLMGYKLDPTSLMNLTLNFRKFLVDQGMWRDDPLKGAQNVVLMANLFQFQSNGAGDLNVNEGAEYMGLILTTSEIGSRLLNSLRRKKIGKDGKEYWEGTGVCSTFTSEGELIVQKESGAIHYKECIREVFFKRVMAISDALPSLKKYIKSLEETGRKYQYVDVVSEFSRDNPKEDYLTKRDILLMVGGVMNIESTIMRFDSRYISMNSCVVPDPNSVDIEGEANFCKKNSSAGDGKLDYQELLWAFEVYQKAIFSIVNESVSKPFLANKRSHRRLIKAAFFYLIKHSRLPKKGLLGNLSLLSFKMFSNHSKIIADRYQIGMLLKFVADGGRK